MKYKIERKLNRTGKHFVYYPTINGRRLSKTNWLRKYDAEALVTKAIEVYGKEKLQETFA